MWYQMQKGAEISGVEFTKKMWSTIQRPNELGDLEKEGEEKISGPMIKNS